MGLAWKGSLRVGWELHDLSPPVRRCVRACGCSRPLPKDPSDWGDDTIFHLTWETFEGVRERHQ